MTNADDVTTCPNCESYGILVLLRGPAIECSKCNGTGGVHHD